jgi:parvulin-like peptidyl-prolyl isomerase
MDDDKKIKLSAIVYGILVVLVAVIIIGSILAYGTQTTIGKKIADVIAAVIPFPAAIVDHTHVVYLKDVRKNLASIEKFYQYQEQDLSKEGLRIDFSTPDGKKRLEIKKREVLDKLVEDKIIEILAQARGISISEKTVDAAVAQKLAEYGTAKDFQDNLANSYGWNLEDFKKRIVLPGAYKDALAAYVTNENLDNSASKVKIEQAKKELDNGKSFAQVVSDYSEGPSRASGGELGWVKKNQLVPELQDVLFSSKMPDKNAVIESQIGFHIVEVENKKKENGEEVLQLRQVFVTKNAFADWLDSEKKKMSVLVPLSEFTWNNSTGSVDFRNEEMRSFEKEERAKVQGDASIMF